MAAVSLATLSAPAMQTPHFRTSFTGETGGLRGSAASASNMKPAPASASLVVRATGCRDAWNAQRLRATEARRRSARAAALAASWQAGCGFAVDPCGIPSNRRWAANMEPFGRSLAEMLRELGSAKVWDVEESSDGWTLRFELPGFSSNDVKVQVEDASVLLITARPPTDDAKEREQGRFVGRRGVTARLAIPDSVNAEGITAELKNGLLLVRLPKVQAEKPRSRVVDVPLSGGPSAITKETTGGKQAGESTEKIEMEGEKGENGE